MMDSTSKIQEKEIEYLREIVQKFSGCEDAGRFHMIRYLADISDFKSGDLLTGNRRADLAPGIMIAASAMPRRRRGFGHRASDAH